VRVASGPGASRLTGASSPLNRFGIREKIFHLYFIEADPNGSVVVDAEPLKSSKRLKWV